MNKKNVLLALSCFTIIVLVSCGATKSLVSDKQSDKKSENGVMAVPQNEFTKFESFNRDNFDENSIVINNEWLPMKPGTELLFEGHDIDEDGEKLEHTVMWTITNLTKVIHGVNTVVLFERDYKEGELEEGELAFFAQDKDGNVWHFGQYTEVYDSKEFVGGRMWVVGLVEHAKAGIMMHANPKKHTESYSHGFAPSPFNWTDRARVYKTGEKISNGSGNYDDVLVIAEYSAEEPDAYQLKYYAKDLGNIGIGWVGNDPNKETMDLVEVRKLSSDDLNRRSKEALKLEQRAYIYGNTPACILVDNDGHARSEQ